MKPLGGCNTGSISGRPGNLEVETDGDALRDMEATPANLPIRRLWVGN
jgi:hypothetical protein